MRRLFMWLMILMMLAAPACAQEQLLDRAVEMAAMCDAIAEDEGYLNAMSANSSITAMIQSWAAGSHDQPRLAVRLDTDALMSVLMQSFNAEGTLQLESAGLAMMQRRLPMSLPSMLNAASGAETLAASTVATASTIFASDAQGCGVYLLLYDAAMPVMVSWYAENGAVSMQAVFVPRDELAVCQSAGEVAAWLAGQGLPLSCETAGE